MHRDKLIHDLNNLLVPEKYKDYCPNGLQIQGSVDIERVVTGVSLNQELIDLAISGNAQAIIVHHGIFWNKGAYPITGLKYDRISKLIKNNINLIAYHLPLDNHAILGNNIQLANLLGIKPFYQTGDQDLIWCGELTETISLNQFIDMYQIKTRHQPVYFGLPDKPVRKIAWCTGGADSMFEEVIGLDVDVFLTGEIKEPIMHLSKESGVAFIAGGHYTTERYGIMALTDYLVKEFGMDAKFIELYNPI